VVAFNFETLAGRILTMVNSEKLFHTESAITIAKSNESLEAAKILFDKQCYNRAVTSAYFACYQYALVALDRHQNEQYPISDVRKHNHKSIINAFSRYLIQEDKIYPDEIRSYLKELQNHRHLADYDPSYSFDKEDAEWILQKAVDFCTTVKSKLGGSQN
jgi:uncharacterized protein (UPF0332 family)